VQDKDDPFPGEPEIKNEFGDEAKSKSGGAEAKSSNRRSPRKTRNTRKKCRTLASEIQAGRLKRKTPAPWDPRPISSFRVFRVFRG
jgi:hypothetical protein